MAAYTSASVRRVLPSTRLSFTVEAVSPEDGASFLSTGAFSVGLLLWFVAAQTTPPPTPPPSRAQLRARAVTFNPILLFFTGFISCTGPRAGW